LGSPLNFENASRKAELLQIAAVATSRSPDERSDIRDGPLPPFPAYRFAHAGYRYLACVTAQGRLALHAYQTTISQASKNNGFSQ
jgi:hypothetical protein